MLTTMLLGLALVAPAEDTPIEPITAESVRHSVQTDPNMLDACDGYAMVSYILYDTMSPGDADALMAAVDQWAIDQYETGWELNGGSARLTDEAEDVFLDFLHTC